MPTRNGCDHDYVSSQPQLQQSGEPCGIDKCQHVFPDSKGWKEKYEVGNVYDVVTGDSELKKAKVLLAPLLYNKPYTVRYEDGTTGNVNHNKFLRSRTYVNNIYRKDELVDDDEWDFYESITRSPTSNKESLCLTCVLLWKNREIFL